MPALAMPVDQSLVDAFLSRVDRFVKNVHELEDNLKNYFTSSIPEKEEPVYQETAAAQPAQSVVTADDINIDELLSGIDLGGMQLG